MDKVAADQVAGPILGAADVNQAADVREIVRTALEAGLREAKDPLTLRVTAGQRVLLW